MAGAARVSSAWSRAVPERGYRDELAAPPREASASGSFAAGDEGAEGGAADASVDEGSDVLRPVGMVGNEAEGNGFDFSPQALVDGGGKELEHRDRKRANGLAGASLGVVEEDGFARNGA